MVSMELKIYMLVSQVVIGSNGVENNELKLDEKEKKNFELSISSVKELFLSATKLDQDLKN